MAKKGVKPKNLDSLHSNTELCPFSSKPKAEQQVILRQTLKRALNDERIEDIAQSLGLARSTLNYHLLSQVSDDWRDIQAARALTALQDAERELSNPPDQLALAAARERVRAAQWNLEKLHRRLYGDKLDVVHSGNVTITRQQYNDLPAIEGQAQIVEDK